MQDPIDRLLAEHRVLMAQLAPLRGVVADLGRRGEAALAEALPVLDAVTAVMTGELLAHARREDDALFPELETHFGAAGTPTAVMREEHRTIRDRADLFRRTLRELNEVEHPAIVAGGERLRALAAGSGRPEDLHALGSGILELLELHFEKEEQILFPMAREVLPAPVLEQIARTMEAIDAGRA